MSVRSARRVVESPRRIEVQFLDEAWESRRRFNKVDITSDLDVGEGRESTRFRKRVLSVVGSAWDDGV